VNLFIYGQEYFNSEIIYIYGSKGQYRENNKPIGCAHQWAHELRFKNGILNTADLFNG